MATSPADGAPPASATLHTIDATTRAERHVAELDFRAAAGRFLADLP